MSNPLANLDRACRLLAQVRNAADAKKVADLARVAEVYARKVQLSEEAIAHAVAIKVDATTLMGEFLKAAPKNAGARGVGRSGVPPGHPTLAAAGISKKGSATAQALA